MKALQILNIRAMPLVGSEISEIKREASEYAKGLKCQVTFNHNGQEYVADDEGNVAKAQNNLATKLGYPV